MAEKNLHFGGCLCGALRYQAKGDPTYVGACHCDDCRRATGGAYVPWFGMEYQNFEITKGEMAEYMSSPGIKRGFCGKCGTSLTFGGEGWTDLGVTVASLDEPSKFTPQSNVFLKDRLHWVKWDEKMRNYETFPSERKE